ncbi:MAG TPA: tyrosine-type recombinase/integrase [Terriglobales bacterium]|nr:tyrosine-type recombinase/integrase [Terriglobales bacterium]
MPKRVPPLSAKTLAAVRPGSEAIELVDGFLPGLRVRILPSGARTWSLNVRDSKGVRRRFDVGAGLGLAEARRKAERLRQAVREGADPTTQRRAARQRAQAARDGEGTLRALLDTYFVTGPGGRQRRVAQNKQLVQAVFNQALGKPMLDIHGHELQLIADSWRSAATASLAVRLIRPCLKWAEKRGLVLAGVANLEQPATVRKRERVLATDELRGIWRHLRGPHGDVIKWLLWTGCRLNEAAGMTWGEIEATGWVIPAARAKNGRQRTVPLPAQAVDLLRSFEPGKADALVFPSKRGGMLSNWDRETKRLQALSNTTGWHRHDLRRTVATMLGDLGFAPHVVSVVLGHAHIAEGATAVYARSRYQREHREALQALADEINLVVAGKRKIVLFAVQ